MDALGYRDWWSHDKSSKDCSLKELTCVYKTHDGIQKNGSQGWHCQSNDDLVVLGQRSIFPLLLAVIAR